MEASDGGYMQKNITEYWMPKVHDDDVRQMTAIVNADGTKVSFGELFDDAASIGTWLIDGISPNGPVAVFLPKGQEAAASDMGILYAGHFYCNMDIASPAERNARILEHIQPVCVLTTKKLMSKLPETHVQIVCLEDIVNTEADEEAISHRLSHVVDTDPLCLINTSGSTGTPKAVALSHRSTIDFMDNAISELSLDGSEVMGSLSPVYFDIYTLEIWLMLAKQAQMVIVPEMYAAFPEKLAAYLEERNISFIFWVPTVMVNMANLDILAAHRLTALKKVLFAGEVFPLKHLAYWMEHLPETTFINMYGPIEITVDCLYHIMSRKDIEDGSLPIGRPFRNTDVMILDDDRPCKPGERGELCVRGSSLALGYYRDPEKTSRAFVQNPLNDAYPETIYRTGDIVWEREDGEIMIAGRKDFQVKHFGYRIELQEIEAVAVRLDFIDNACVLYDHDKKQIVLVYEAARETNPREIRTELSRLLPKYCLPTQFHQLDEMPRNPNGKIDRNRLKEMLVG